MKKDGSIESIYCHYDGYPTGVGSNLYKYYSDYDVVKELINLGDIESLKEKVKSDGTGKDNVTVAYHRDLGEKLKTNTAKINKNIDEFNDMLFDAWVGYIYLYDEKSGKWLWDNYYIASDKLELKPLEEYFEIEDVMEEISCSEVLELRNSGYDYLVLQGCGGDLNEWVDGITKLLIENDIIPKSFKFRKVYLFENNDLSNMAFPLDSKDIDIGKLAMFRLKIRESFGAMWLSDYINNGYIKDVNI